MNLYRTAAVVTLFSAAEHCLGFLYRIILSRTIGSEGLGVYQAAYTVFAVFLTISASGLPVTLSRVISRHRARGARHREQAAVTGAVLITLAFSVPITVLLFLFREQFSGVFADPRCADLFYILLAGLVVLVIQVFFAGTVTDYYFTTGLAVRAGLYIVFVVVVPSVIIAAALIKRKRGCVHAQNG